MMGLPGRQRSLTISSAIWIECTNVTDGQTDGHRATAKTALTHSVARKKSVTCIVVYDIFIRYQLTRLAVVNGRCC